MTKYALIGKDVRFSYSKIIHETLSNNSYALLSLDSDQEFLDFLKTDFIGLNITMPYKQLAYRNCDLLTKEAKATGVINTILKKDNKLIGFNTDIDGFSFLLKQNNISLKNKVVAILGTGGSSKTVHYIANKQNAKMIFKISRKPNNRDTFGYESEILKDVEVIINTTPIGQYPHNDDEPLFNFGICKKLEAFIDLNYNPIISKQRQIAKRYCLKVINGLDMLIYQAMKSHEIFEEKKYSLLDYKKVILNIITKMSNIALIGHPCSGKSTIGKKLAIDLNMSFIDIDNEIENRENNTISSLIIDKGINYFRKIEAKVIEEYSTKTGYVIATGGGAILKEDNVINLARNSIIINLVRNISLIDEDSLSSRPNTPNMEKLNAVIKQRKLLYEKYSAFTILNNDTMTKVIENIKEML